MPKKKVTEAVEGAVVAPAAFHKDPGGKLAGTHIRPPGQADQGIDAVHIHVGAGVGARSAAGNRRKARQAALGFDGPLRGLYARVHQEVRPAVQVDQTSQARFGQGLILVQGIGGV